jgi:hypothetical protein
MFDCVFPTRTAVRMNTEKLTDNFLYQFVLWDNTRFWKDT